MFPQQKQKPVKKDKDECVIEKRKTKTGTKIVIKGKCSREKLDMAKQNDFD